MKFIEKLLSASRKNRSLLCIGLDPDPVLMPDIDIVQFNREIIEATSDLVCAYKPNLAFYEALGIEGIKTLESTLRYIPGDIPVIGDAKRGDIGSSSKAYAKAVFEVFGFDAVTVSPYMGYDSIEPFLNYSAKGVFILCKTSNKGSSDFQELLCSDSVSDTDLMPLYQIIAIKAREWNADGNIGLVVGATYPLQLRKIREICPDMPLLIPGIGTQGGDLAKTVEYGVDIKGERAVINCARQVLYASNSKDFAEEARRQAKKLQSEINTYRFKSR